MTEIVFTRQLPRFRRPKLGPEFSMVIDALGCGLAGLPSGEKIIFQEPEIEYSFPDVVVAIRRRGLTGVAEPRGLDASHFRVLNHLHFRKSKPATSIPVVADSLCLPLRRATKLVEKLVSSKLATYTSSGAIRPAPIEKSFGLGAIVAIEAKMSNWRGALNQAVRNTWFASHSYILLPEARASAQSIAEAATAGIGIITFDGIECKTKLRPIRRPLPTSYAAWLVDEWACASSHVECVS